MHSCSNGRLNLKQDLPRAQLASYPSVRQTVPSSRCGELIINAWEHERSQPSAPLSACHSLTNLGGATSNLKQAGRLIIIHIKVTGNSLQQHQHAAYFLYQLVVQKKAVNYVFYLPLNSKFQLLMISQSHCDQLSVWRARSTPPSWFSKGVHHLEVILTEQENKN